MKISETKLRHVIREEIAQTNESNEARLVRSFYDLKDELGTSYNASVARSLPATDSAEILAALFKGSLVIVDGELTIPESSF